MYKLPLRFVPILAFWLTLAALALALTTLLAGIKGNHLKSGAIATFNISSLGLSAYYDPTSPLHTDITALVPQDIINPPSITQHLGAHDWYRMNYFSNCSGFFAPSKSNPSLLTSTKVNMTCTRRGSGYVFRPHDVVKYELLPGVKALGDEISSDVWDTSSWISLWFTGLSNCFITALELPFNFGGRRTWMNFWCAWNAFISATLFLAESAVITHRVLNLYHADGLPGPNPWSGIFMGLTWSSTVLMWVVCAMMTVQWRLERGNGCCEGSNDTRRVTGSEAPVEERKSENTFVDGRNP